MRNRAVSMTTPNGVISLHPRSGSSHILVGLCVNRIGMVRTLPMHKHPEIEQTYVIEGSFYDHDGICRAGEFVWRRVGSFHETHSDEGAVILAVYRKPNIFQHSTGYVRKSAPAG
jgi:anti-sigma factor ChrR (cupin superfamily)